MEEALRMFLLVSLMVSLFMSEVSGQACPQMKSYYSIMEGYTLYFYNYEKTGDRGCGIFNTRRCDTYGHVKRSKTAYRTAYIFSCIGGYSMPNCDDTNECTIGTHICQQNCHNTCGSYTCSCNSGYLLNANGRQCDDINECDDKNGGCQHGCNNEIGSYHCTCNSGYVLDSDMQRCYDVDECAVENGGCDHNCSNTVGSFSCACNEGYDLSFNGLNCNDIDECSGNHGCQQTCINTPGSFNCTCTDGYELDGNGLACNDIDECILDKHTCSDVCNNTIGGFNCDCFSGYKLQRDGFNCVDIDECAEDIHDCQQICTNTNGSYLCSCQEGYFESHSDGKLICEDINECTKDHGHNCSQICDNLDGTYECSCKDGYRIEEDGFNCADIDECELGTDRCQQVCHNTVGSYSCSCKNGYQLNPDMETCDDIDECSLGMHTCTELQLCNNVLGTFGCYCQSGYVFSPDGETCEKFIIGASLTKLKEPNDEDFTGKLREITNCAGELCSCISEIFSDLHVLGYTKNVTMTDNATICSELRADQRSTASDLILAIFGREGNGLVIPVEAVLSKICYNCAIEDFYVETHQTIGRLNLFPELLLLDYVSLQMNITGLPSSPQINNLNTIGSMFLHGIEFKIRINMTSSVWFLKAYPAGSMSIDLVEFVASVTGIKIPIKFLNNAILVSELCLNGIYDIDNGTLFLSMEGKFSIGKWFSDSFCFILYQSIANVNRIPPQFGLLTGCHSLNLPSITFSRLVQELLHIDISGAFSFFDKFSLPKLQLAFTGPRPLTDLDFKLPDFPFPSFNLPNLSAFFGKNDGSVDFVFDFPIINLPDISKKFNLKVNFSVFEFQAIDLVSLGDLLGTISGLLQLPNIDLLSGINLPDINVKRMYLNLKTKLFSILGELKIAINLFSNGLQMQILILNVELDLSDIPRIQQLYISGTIHIGGTTLLGEIRLLNDQFNLNACANEINLLDVASDLSSNLIRPTVLNYIGINELVIHMPCLNISDTQASVSVETICISGEIRLSSTLEAGLSACVDRDKDWVFGVEVRDFLLANLFKPLIGRLAKRIAFFNQELDVALLITPKAYETIPLYGSVLNKIATPLPKGVIVYAETAWPNGCDADIFCVIARSLLGEDAKIKLTASFQDNGVTSVKAKVNDFQLGPLRLSAAFIDMRFTPSETSIAIAAEADLGFPPVTLIGGLRLKFPQFTLALELSMNGCWEQAFGLPLDFCNLFINVGIFPGVPLPGLALGGMVRIGNPHCYVLEITAALGIDPNDHTQNFFYAEVNRLTLQSVLDLFCIRITLPSFLGNTGFPDGVITSYALLPKYLPALQLTIPAGFYFKGTMNWFGLKVESEILLNPPEEIKVRARLFPLKIAGGLLQMTESSTVTDKGPFLYAVFKSNPLKFDIQAMGYVSVLGISVEASLRISNEQYEIQVAGNILGVLKARLTVYAKYSNILSSNFRAAGCIDISILNKIAEAVKKGIKSIADGASSAIEGAQKKIEEANAVFDKAVGVLRSAEDKVRSARAKIRSARAKIDDISREIGSICRIKRCSTICIPFICGCGCLVKAWKSCVVPCLKFSSCCFKITDPICLFRNAICVIIQAALRVALFAAQALLVVAEQGLRVVELTFRVAQVAVDKARVVVDIAKAALEVLKQGISFGLKILEAVITFSINGIINIEQICFDAGLGTFRSHIEVNAKISFFGQSPVDLGLRISITNPLSVVGDLVDRAFSFLGKKKKRSIEDPKANKTQWLQRHYLKQGTPFPVNSVAAVNL